MKSPSFNPAKITKNTIKATGEMYEIVTITEITDVKIIAEKLVYHESCLSPDAFLDFLSVVVFIRKTSRTHHAEPVSQTRKQITTRITMFSIIIMIFHKI